MLEPKQFVNKGQCCPKELSVKGGMTLCATLQGDSVLSRNKCKMYFSWPLGSPRGALLPGSLLKHVGFCLRGEAKPQSLYILGHSQILGSLGSQVSQQQQGYIRPLPLGQKAEQVPRCPLLILLSPATQCSRKPRNTLPNSSLPTSCIWTLIQYHPAWVFLILSFFCRSGLKTFFPVT